MKNKFGSKDELRNNLMSDCKVEYHDIKVDLTRDPIDGFVYTEDRNFNFAHNFAQLFFHCLELHKKNEEKGLGGFKTYILSDSNVGIYKIGKSRDMKGRIKDLSIGNAYLNLVAYIDKDIERELHKRLDNKRFQGEWFRLTKKEVNEIIEEYGFKIAKSMYE